MKIQNISMWAVSPKNDYKDTDLYKNKFWWIQRDYNFMMNNREPLPKVYNTIIESTLKTSCDCLILSHDDIWFHSDPVTDLEQLFDDFDLVGVAGTSKISLQPPALWHIMGGGFNSGFLHGQVHHWSDEHCQSFPTNFGKYPHRAVMIDGVFMAMNRKVMENMRFDESNPAKFHFYDLDFSLNCHMNGYKVGVGGISITHKSPGLKEFTDEWRLGEKWFLNKYAQ